MYSTVRRNPAVTDVHRTDRVVSVQLRHGTISPARYGASATRRWISGLHSIRYNKNLLAALYGFPFPPGGTKVTEIKIQ